MLSAETLRNIRRIELRTRRLVNNSFAGAYHSVFKGRGIEFDAVRPYQPGDDIRSIDWIVTARAGEPFIKGYAEERELTVILVLDTSASCLFGSVNRQKRDLAVELGAVLAYAAITNHDKVGLLLFSDQLELYVSPRKGRNHVLRLIRDLLAAKPSRTGTNIASALRMVNRLQKHQAIVFLISDFLENVENYARELAITSRNHDVIAVILSDPLERAWQDVGLVTLQDAETGVVRTIDTSLKSWKQQFAQQSRRFRKLRDAALVRANVDQIELQSNDDYAPALMTFFRGRVQRLRK